MFDIEIISIEISLGSVHYQITENTIPINKDSSVRGGWVSVKNNRGLLAKEWYFEYS